MKKLFLLLVLSLLPIVASADAVEIDGIYYKLNSETNQAEVTRNPNNYTGSVSIPASVIYGGAEYSVTSIGTYAFSECSGLTSITIGNSVTSIGNYAFQSCSGLTSVTIGNSVTNIGGCAFWYCRNLTSVTIPNSVTSIEAGAFKYCSSLTSVTMGNSVTSIEGGTFMDCYSLTSVHITDLAAWCNINFFSSDANPLFYAHHLFLNGQEIKDLVIPNSVKRIEVMAFSGCSGLTSVIIPESVTSIGNAAFSGCSGLTSVTIPNSVTSIGGYAFYKCIGLTSVTIPYSVTYIGEYAFYECSGLTSITIPYSVTYIGSNAFQYCSGLTSITIGSGVKTIGGQAFQYCSKLTDVYCLAESVPSTNSYVFKDSNIENATLHVPAASMEAYRAVEPWKNFGSIVAIDGETPEPQKCATPTISYVNGEIVFDCETEGVEYISEIKASDAKKYYDGKIVPTNTYLVTVYATKEGYEDSEVATQEITIGSSGLKGDMNGDGVVDLTDAIIVVYMSLGAEM